MIKTYESNTCSTVRVENTIHTLVTSKECVRSHVCPSGDNENECLDNV